MCEDPFHNNYTTDILERPCMGGRKNRNGLFPAAACIKVAGTYCKNISQNLFDDLNLCIILKRNEK